MPGVDYLDEPSGAPFVMAHRGFAASVHGGVHDENSLAAFARAVALGVDHLETDVRVTADGVAVAFHDSVLDRVTDARGEVAALPWATVRRAQIGGREAIPLLADVLDAFPDARVNIDVKSDAGVSPTVTAIRQARALDRVGVGAFSDLRTRRLRRALGPDVATALAPAEVARLRALSGSGPLGRYRPARWPRRAVQVPHRIGRYTLVDRRLVATAHRLGLPVHVWTVNDPAQMRALLELGVDGLITDRADLALDVVAGRTS